MNDERRATEGSIPSAAIEDVFRAEWGRAVAITVRFTADIELAEEAVQDAFLAALERWPNQGVPDKPAAWIVTTARNKVIDRRRRQKRLWQKQGHLRQLAELELEPGRQVIGSDDESGIVDDRLRLIFTCCHPALAMDARVALTLRTLGGLTTTEIARAFLVPEATLAQRLVRAKRKIRAAAIPYRVPPEHLLPERLASVLAVLYLIFTEGYAGTSAARLVRRDLCDEAIRLTRLVSGLMPDEPEAQGLLALMLLHDARREGRVSSDGELILLEHQDRSTWDQAVIKEGLALLDRGAGGRDWGGSARDGGGRPAGPYRLQAHIAALHAQAPTMSATDWATICDLYERLAELTPSPIAALNHAVAVSLRDGPAAGLARLDAMSEDPLLQGYHLFHSARADLLRRLEVHAEAAQAYRRALDLATNPVERRFLERRLSELRGRR
ncbi:MAG: RNA polymerase sigma factor [Candidatus Limnocylindrales bacterium]